MTEKYGLLTVQKLREELKKRKAKTTGKKEDLIQRLATYDRYNNFVSVQENTVHVEEIQLLWPPEENFLCVQQTSIIPPVDMVHLNHYFWIVYNDQQGMSMCSAVHRKGYNMMLNDFLIALVKCSQDGYVFFHGQVSSEMTKNLTYFVKVALQIDGSIVESNCECIAGKGHRAVCKHVAVLCYALLHFHQSGHWKMKKSCTDIKQVWHMPKKTKLALSPVKAQDLKFSNEVYNVKKRHIGNLCYDPRKLCHRNMPSYNDFNRNMIINYRSKNGTFGINGIFKPASIIGIINDHNYLQQHPVHQMIYDHIQVSAAEAQRIEKNTHGQSRNKTWIEERTIRITASNVGTIVHMTEKRNKETFAQSLIYPKEFHFVQTEWGKINEKKAIEKYEEMTNNKVNSCGLFISTAHPFIAGSPDGLVGDHIVVEVKCPYSIRNENIPNTWKYLEYKNNTLLLKSSSNHYFQIQTQMYVTERYYCHFVIWTNTDFKYIIIERDDELINNIIIPKLREFYETVMLPILANKFFY